MLGTPIQGWQTKTTDSKLKWTEQQTSSVTRTILRPFQHHSMVCVCSSPQSLVCTIRLKYFQKSAQSWGWKLTFLPKCYRSRLYFYMFVCISENKMITKRKARRCLLLDHILQLSSGYARPHWLVADDVYGRRNNVCLFVYWLFIYLYIINDRKFWLISERSFVFIILNKKSRCIRINK